MQFQIACKHCHRPFVIESEGGNTLRCNCPYCGDSMTVATPQMGAPSGSAAEIQLLLLRFLPLIQLTITN